MRFNFSFVEFGKNLLLNSDQGNFPKKRFVSELVDDKVIMDLKGAKDFLESRGDEIAYEVYNLWKSDESAKKILKSSGLMADLTLLNHGIFSTGKTGELFCTYGHAHEKFSGEAYHVIKNDCFLLLSDKKSFKTFLVHLKEKDTIFIHPTFMHRLICGKKDSALLSFVPKEAGHDYDIIKNRGFPFHVFSDEKRKNLTFKKNPKYPSAKFTYIKKFRSKFDAMKLADKKEKFLSDLLRDPEKNKNIYPLIPTK